MKLKDYLSLHNISQADFARSIDESPQNVSRYVKDRIPEKAVMRKIVHETGGEVTPNDFYDDTDDEPSKGSKTAKKNGEAVHCKS